MALSREYDPIFAKYAGSIPVPYIRSLSWCESALNPKAQNPGSSATGLLQVIDSTREGYNQRNGTSYTRDDLKEPDIGAKLGINELRRVVDSLALYHPWLKVDWNNPVYVELVTAGFNAGWSEEAGVGKVLTEMEKKGIANNRINVDTLAQSAPMVGGSKYLSEPDRVKHWKRVSSVYFNEPDAPKSGKSMIGKLKWPLLFIGGALAFWKLSHKEGTNE